MYKPFNKVVPPAKPNSFECAVWKYATCPLEDPIPEPQTRVEQLAKDFVFDKKTATNSCKLKEISRCISVCETYDEYERNPQSFGKLPPVEIKIGFGKEEEQKGENSIAEVNSSKEGGPSSADTVNLPIDVENVTDEKLADLPRLTALSTIQEVCGFFHKLTQDENFAFVPGTSEGIKALIDKLPTTPFAQLYSQLVKENPQIAPQYKLAVTRLGDFYKELQTKECEQQTSQGLGEIAAFGRTTTVGNDIVAELRSKELPAAVDYINNEEKIKDDEIWSQRFTIGAEMNVEKAKRLVQEFPNRTPKELYEFWQYLIKKDMSSWENVHIMNHLDPIVTENEKKKKRG